MHWSYDFLKIRKTITILAQCKWEKFNGEFILVVSVTWNDQCYCYSPAFCSGFSWACWIVRFWENLLCPCLLKSFVTCIELWEKFKIYLSDFYLRIWRVQWWWVLWCSGLLILLMQSVIPSLLWTMVNWLRIRWYVCWFSLVL